MKAHIEYLKYVLRHKWFVFVACANLGVPFWQAVIHDLSKFEPVEWFPYVHAFYNPDGSKRVTKTDSGTLDSNKVAADFSAAWNHHQKVNPHHWQYWVLINDEDGMVPLEMPAVFVLEMLADWDGAGRAITGKSDPAGWYRKNGYKMILHDKTRLLVSQLLHLHYS
jgi:hypothetical protein